VIKPIPSYLKLVTAGAEPVTRESEDLQSLLTCCRAFEHAIGWPLEFVSGKPAIQESNLLWSAPVDPGVGASPGHIRIVADAAAIAGSKPAVALPEAKQLASALAGIWDELLRTRKSLWQREAELAAGVPVAARPDEQHLAARLEGVLAAGAESLDCQAAALYLLDAGTSELKLRASWGLPRGRLMEAARPLRGAAADLEALLGHAVVLDDPKMFDFWRVPEPCAAAVCVPVSSPTTPLGTLWLFANEFREFSSAQTNLLEVVAGRLAGDLEREMLLREVASLRIAHPPAADMEGGWRVAQPPSPRLDGWDFAGWSAAGDHPGGGWCDWFTIASDQFAMVLGTCSTDAVGVLGGTAARLAVRTTADMQIGPAQLLNRLNAAFWAGGQAEASVGLNYAVLDTHHGVLRSSQCGPVGLIATHRGATRVMEAVGQSLGAEHRLPVQEQQFKLAPGDVAVLWGGPNAADTKSAARDRVATEVSQHFELPAAQLAARIGALLCEQESAWASLVVRRQKRSKR
jgi:hypothetical protein